MSAFYPKCPTCSKLKCGHGIGGGCDVKVATWVNFSFSCSAAATKCHGHQFAFTFTHLADSGEEVEDGGDNCVHHGS